ncbi:hypothetical protein DWG20_08565 [Crenobacter cavernae]|uniref:Uncharacterized protein n=2 Tax=Crenobacter cavernae TaxID=2290923 RepID=A0A345Y6D0_9NEIS|nr:hypothetical protein DWG20_08565 [Crenobacter cavernae]
MALLLGASALAQAEVNMEFKFTPFVGAENEAGKIEVMPGTARIYVNGALHSERKLAKASVLADGGGVAPSLSLPVSSLGEKLKRGANTLRVEFRPADANKRYRVQFGWAAASDSIGAADDAGRRRSGNQASSTGRQTRDAVGPVAFESRFSAIAAVESDALDAETVGKRDKADGSDQVAGEAMRRNDLAGARPPEIPADAGATQLPNLPNTPPPSAAPPAASAPPPSSSPGSTGSSSSPWWSPFRQ